MGSGLGNSRWARHGGNGTHNFNRGDQICPLCGFDNFAWRTACFRCSTPLDNDKINKPVTISSAPTLDHIFQTADGEGGLALSRYAPRNSHGHYKPTDVWTRTTALTKSTASSSPYNPHSPRSTSPDLGLPYEVQHFILEMMRRILEEGSYDFASRIMPTLLQDQGWTCSEMVELSMWRDTLPAKVPPAALSPIPGYSLQQALTDAVRIRNSATHRHLCDNTELKSMAQNAKSLMVMYGDASRRDKFEWLREELEEWDRGQDDGEKRRILENALQLISERPLESMDWTPNSMSLEEILTTEDDMFDDQTMDLD